MQRASEGDKARERDQPPPRSDVESMLSIPLSHTYYINNYSEVGHRLLNRPGPFLAALVVRAVPRRAPLPLPLGARRPHIRARSCAGR